MPIDAGREREGGLKRVRERGGGERLGPTRERSELGSGGVSSQLTYIDSREPFASGRDSVEQRRRETRFELRHFLPPPPPVAATHFVSK